MSPRQPVIYYPSGSAAPTGLPDGNINVTGVNRVYATWYNAASSGKSSSDPSYGVTRSGQTLKKGIVAVDPQGHPARHATLHPRLRLRGRGRYRRRHQGEYDRPGVPGRRPGRLAYRLG